MTEALAEALRAAGFVGIEVDVEAVFARLPGSNAEVSAWAQEGVWFVAISRPIRATSLQGKVWALEHPEAPLDIHQGETRLLGRFNPYEPAGLLRWATLAEELVTLSLQWRRDQRSRGEGM